MGDSPARLRPLGPHVELLRTSVKSAWHKVTGIWDLAKMHTELTGELFGPLMDDRIIS